MTYLRFLLLLFILQRIIVIRFLSAHPASSPSLNLLRGGKGSGSPGLSRTRFPLFASLGSAYRGCRRNISGIRLTGVERKPTRTPFAGNGHLLITAGAIFQNHSSSYHCLAQVYNGLYHDWPLQSNFWPVNYAAFQQVPANSKNYRINKFNKQTLTFLFFCLVVDKQTAIGMPKIIDYFG